MQKYSFEKSQKEESTREMALLLGEDSFLQLEKTILVAMDEAGEKMEELSMINMLCCRFVAARSSLNDNWLKRLESALGKETVETLATLVSCQKSYNQLLGYSTSDLVNGAEMKKSWMEKLKTNPEKRKFLKEILTKTKMWPGVMIDDSSSQSKTAVNDPDEKIAGVSLHLSVVGLLRTALESEYRKHVLRCFKELDVDSLLNILYLLIPSSLERYEKNNFLTDDDPDMSQLMSLSPKDSLGKRQIETYCEVDSNSSTCDESVHLTWDDEETVIKCDDKLQDTNAEIYQVFPMVDAIVPRNQKLKRGLQGFTEIQAAFRRPDHSTCHTFHNAEMVALHLNKEHQRDGMEAEVVKSYIKFVDTGALQQRETINRLLTDEFHTSNDKIRVLTPCDNGTKNLRHTFYAFRSLVVSMFASGQQSKPKSGPQSFLNMKINREILAVKEEKLKGILEHRIVAQKELQTGWQEKILDWQRQVEDVRCRVDKHVRNCITTHAVGEKCLEKTRIEELSTFHQDLSVRQDSLLGTQTFVKKSVKSLRARRHYLEASLESLIRQYNATMLKYQAKIDELSVEEVANNREIERLQNKFKIIEEKYDEMRAMKRLKQLLQNMEKAEAIKQNWAARKIQVAWRKYKVAKLRKKKLKGRKRGKKKTPSPGKGTSPPTKSSTPGGSRSKSQTP